LYMVDWFCLHPFLYILSMINQNNRIY